MFKKLFVGGAATAIAVSTAGIALASAGHQGGQTDAAGHVSARTTTTFTACDGGVQKRVYNRINSAPFTFSEASGTPFIPTAGVVVSGPVRGADTLSIEFSAETQMGGSTAGDNLSDWMGLEVLVDGVPIQPFTAAGDVLAITGSNAYNSNAAQFCTKIRAGKHKVQVRTNLHDGNVDDALTGWIDDYTLHVEQSE
ncbi:MAG TPA: hypothetical protein VLI04_02200 [Nocardioidaceae bacterium]|nr:hypothetical protein [Nocardioidaceae bacterium]